MPIIDQLNSSNLCIPDIQDSTGPNFENEADRIASIIHLGYGDDGQLTSEDLLLGRRYGQQVRTFVPPSNPPVSIPDSYLFGPYYPSRGGIYKDTGPAKGRY